MQCTPTREAYLSKKSNSFNIIVHVFDMFLYWIEDMFVIDPCEYLPIKCVNLYFYLFLKDRASRELYTAKQI